MASPRLQALPLAAPPARWVAIDLPDGEARLLESFLAASEADACLARLLEELAWEQHTVRMGGRRIPSPRLSAWYGDPGARYAYSGMQLEPRPWTPVLAALRERVEAAAGCAFDSALANLYRDGRDAMGWHSDDERELGPRPTIASLSLGAERRFRLRHRRRRELAPVVVPLRHGSLLVMCGATQRFWKHQLPRSKRVHEPRVNLTFRRIQREGGR